METDKIVCAFFLFTAFYLRREVTSGILSPAGRGELPSHLLAMLSPVWLIRFVIFANVVGATVILIGRVVLKLPPLFD